MKKNYEKPVLTTEQFDVEDVITASAPAVDPQQSAGLGAAGTNWQVPGLVLDWH